ncbi:MAG TPA: putative metal-dependent hydrolase [Longimicrobiales bacterium]|nr:putative metal-dependent hydrolase [Longimicrobiales bacterium]
MESLQYPIGKFTPKGSSLTPDERSALVARIRALPGEARAAVRALDEAQLNTGYREGGWCPRQIVHHLADSHANAFIRFKLALTEDAPAVKTYHQDRWALLADVCGVPVEPSLAILDGLHDRWARLLESLTPDDFVRRVRHPELGDVDLDFLLQMYAWHGRHHVTQVTALRAREGW